jgi:hypothetical protein
VFLQTPITTPYILIDWNLNFNAFYDISYLQVAYLPYGQKSDFPVLFVGISGSVWVLLDGLVRAMQS